MKKEWKNIRKNMKDEKKENKKRKRKVSHLQLKHGFDLLDENIDLPLNFFGKFYNEFLVENNCKLVKRIFKRESLPILWMFNLYNLL